PRVQFFSGIGPLMGSSRAACYRPTSPQCLASTAPSRPALPAASSLSRAPLLTASTLRMAPVRTVLCRSSTAPSSCPRPLARVSSAARLHLHLRLLPVLVPTSRQPKSVVGL